MDRIEWLHILARAADLASLRDWADIIPKTLHVRILRPPRAGLLTLMAEAPEDHTRFRLGEVLVTIGCRFRDPRQVQT